jgi:hypothetical protein
MSLWRVLCTNGRERKFSGAGLHRLHGAGAVRCGTPERFAQKHGARNSHSGENPVNPEQWTTAIEMTLAITTLLSGLYLWQKGKARRERRKIEEVNRLNERKAA